MKEKCLGLADSLEESEKELKRLFKVGQYDRALLLLGDMQQAAAAIGTAIEQQEGEGFPTVALLEEYCDLLYQCANGEPPDAVNTCNAMSKLLRRIRSSIQSDVRKIYEAVFFPYKASMWDSLESVWKAASEHPNCRAFVVPIPYYDKNPDGSLGAMHYEGGQFPEGVPVVSWKEYSLKGRRPDLAFIHNPYDDGNYVTTVHPDYYARELKKYAKYLAYVPYFVAGDIVPGHFCVNGGTLYADRVFVESEAIAKQYRHYFQGFVKSQRLEHVFPLKKIQEKFRGLGSPKIDKAASSRREGYVLPAAWADLLQGKKAVLYNTGVAGILAGDEQELKKIADVLEIFRRRKDVVLWWRPHPLSSETISSMRPHLLEQYRKLVEWYQREGFGIFDHSTDIHRAVACTDMFYGDNSSIGYLYGVQGKPILLQNQSYLRSAPGCARDKTVYFQDCVCEAGKVWFSDALQNGLYEMDLDSGTANFLGNIPEEAEALNYLYGRIFKRQDSLWLVPVRATQLLQYSLTQRRFIKHSLPEPAEGESQKLQYAFLLEDKLYMIAGDSSRLVVMDMQDGSTAWTPLQLRKPGGKYHVCQLGLLPELCAVEGCLYFPIYNTNVIVEYHTETGAVKQFQVGPVENQYLHILYDGRYFWLIPYLSQTGEIVRWDKKTGQIWRLADYPKDFKHLDWFIGACFQGGYLWLFPNIGDQLIKIDLHTLDMACVKWMGGNRKILFAKALEGGGFLTDSYVHYSNHSLVRLDQAGRPVKEYRVDGVGQAPDCTAHMPWQRSFGTTQEYMYVETKQCHIQMVLDWFNRAPAVMEHEKACFQNAFGCAAVSAGEKILEEMLALLGTS